MLTMQDVLDARKRIEPYIYKTPLLRFPVMDDILGCEVYIKHEGFQKTGSFKIRGATNKILSLTDEERAHGVVCSSSGNHAIGVACAAKALGIKATIVMPENANPAKLAGVREYGAETLLVGTLSSQREEKVKELAEQRHMVEVHPYADPYVASGQGTIGLEIMESEPGLDAVIVPIGGGGLSSGVSTAVKNIKPSVRVIGVEPEACPRYALSIAAGECVGVESANTIADGTRTLKAVPSNFETIKKYVDEFAKIDDANIELAMYTLASKARIIAEPSSVMGIAACMAGRISGLNGKKVCFVLSGGNNNLNQLADILKKFSK